MSKTAAAITAARQAGRAAFIGYLPFGYPSMRESIEAAVALAEAGADVIEMGPPYTDPVMDGPVIQQATNAALAKGFQVADIFPAVREITERTGVALLVMSYWNLVLQYGVERFAADLQAAGGAGLITPDITPDNAEEWLAAAGKYDLDRVFLAAQTSSPERLRMISQASRGFVYAVSTMGITGQRDTLDAAAQELVARIKAAGAENVCVGIGVSTAEHVAKVATYADGAIVGTVLVKALGDGGVPALSAKAAELICGLDARI